LDEARWRAVLGQYRLDGKLVLDPGDARAAGRLEQLARYFRAMDETGNEHLAVESAASVRRRTARARVITDDNMATEWAK
jgi:hypothetical protein